MHGTILCHKCYDRSLPLLGSFHLSELASQVSQSINAMRQCFQTESRFWPNWLCSSVINNLVMRCRPSEANLASQFWPIVRVSQGCQGTHLMVDREQIKINCGNIRQFWNATGTAPPPLPYPGRLSVERSLNHSSLQRCDTPKLNASLYYLELTNWLPRSSTQFELIYHFLHSWIAGESIFYMISGRISPILCRLQRVFRVDN